MTPDEVRLILQLGEALAPFVIDVGEEVLKAFNSAKRTGDPWADLAAERVEDIMRGGLKAPIDALALKVFKAAA